MFGLYKTHEQGGVCSGHVLSIAAVVCAIARYHDVSSNLAIRFGSGAALAVAALNNHHVAEQRDSPVHIRNKKVWKLLHLILRFCAMQEPPQL